MSMRIESQDYANMKATSTPVEGTSLQDAVERTVHETKHYEAEYGLRIDDGAGVIQIFPVEQNPNNHSLIRDALDAGLLNVLRPAWEYKAEFVFERDLGLNSYYIQIEGLRRSPLPDRIFFRFFTEVDEFLRSHDGS